MPVCLESVGRGCGGDDDEKQEERSVSKCADSTPLEPTAFPSRQPHESERKTAFDALLNLTCPNWPGAYRDHSCRCWSGRDTQAQARVQSALAPLQRAIKAPATLPGTLRILLAAQQHRTALSPHPCMLRQHLSSAPLNEPRGGWSRSFSPTRSHPRHPLPRSPICKPQVHTDIDTIASTWKDHAIDGTVSRLPGIASSADSAQSSQPSSSDARDGGSLGGVCRHG